MTTQLSIRLSQLDAVEWDSCLAGLGGTPFSRYAWANYLAAVEGGAPCHLEFVDESGSAIGLAVGTVRAAPSKLLAPVTRELVLDAWPAIAEARLDDAFRALAAWARRFGIVRVVVGSFGTPWRDVTPMIKVFTRRLEFPIAIDRSDDLLLSGFESMRRRNIKKAIRAGVEVRELPGWEGVIALRSLQGESARRIVARGGPDIRFDGQLEADPVRKLLEGGVARVFAAIADGQCVSAALLAHSSEVAYYVMAGHDARALETQAPTLLIWSLIQRFRSEGIRVLSLGGCSADAQHPDHPEHGVYRYKLGFAGVPIESRSGSITVRPVLERVGQLARGLHNVFRRERNSPD